MLISELYSNLPTGISREDRKSIAQYIADTFGEAEGFQFCFDKSRTISEKACGFPSEFANATDYKFRCSQRRRASNNKPSSLPYSRTRNRRSRKVMHDCHGGISVVFPSSTTTYDIAVQFVHSPHPGYEHYGVPVKVRAWIKDNPRSTPGAQRADLVTAIRKGEIAGIKPGKYFTAQQIHYWWRKGFGKTAYISNDSWINAEHILNQHPKVNRLAFHSLIVYRFPILS